MDLNENIWGTYDDNAQPIVSGIYGDSLYYSDKVGAESLLSYYNEYGHDSPIDESVNYWQIADFSSLNRYVYMHLNGNNVFEYTTTNSKTALSIFLAKSTPNNIDMSFNPTASGNRMWNDFVTGSTGFTNNHKIFPWFDYNKILLRPSLYVFKLDENGAPTGSLISTGDKSKIYNFFHDDENGAPIREQYVITGVALYFLYGSETAQTYSTYDYPCIATSTPLEIPKPNYYLNEYAYFNTYQRIGSMHIGSNTRQLNVTQTGAYGQNTASSACYVYDPAYWDIKEYQVGTSTYRYFAYTGTYEDLLKQLATIGFWFRDDCEGGTWGATGVNAKTIGTGCTDEHCFLPEIINGRTTGNYKRGSAAGADIQATWGNSWRENVGYTGDKPYTDEQKNTGDLTTVFNRPSITGSCLYYNLTESEMRDLITFINTGYQPMNNDQFILDFKGTNPADYISTIIYYPTDFTCANYDIIQRGVGIGALSGLDTGVQGYIADITKNNIISFNTLSIPEHFRDFRDYNPYTTLDLYVPFCGNVELDPSIFIGHTLQIKLIIDYPTGNCTGVIMCDNLVYDTINGSCGVSIPLTALNVGSYQNAIKSAEIALKQAEIQRKTAWLSVAGSGLAVVGGAAMGNPIAIAGGVAGMIGALNSVERADLAVESAQYQLTHTAPTTRNVSAASPANALELDYDCHLLIKRASTPNGFDDAIYSHTVGNACAINAPLSSFSGFTVCADVDLSGISAPAEIKTAILNALKSGVYI